MRAMTGVRTNQASSFSVPSVHSSPSYPLYVHHTSPLHMIHNFLPYLVILSLPLSILSCPSSSLSLSSFLLPSLPSILSSLPSSLPGITLVDETSPVDEPSTSDQVTEGVKFAYTLPHQQSNQEDSQDDTALVCVHIHACVAVPGRNRTLFCCVLRLHCFVRSALAFPLRRGSYALGKLINTCHVYTASMSPALNRSSALQHFERSNAIEIRNGIMFDFYPGLPHVCVHI